MKIIDLAGKKFGRLEVLSQDGITASGHKQWKCLCECGNTTSLRGTLLTQGAVVSCGCHRRESSAERFTKHGLYYHSAYATWNRIMQRCHNPESDDYPEYGGRGIEVCERWHDVANFIADVGERPKGASIDRIRNGEGYKPDNWRWSNPVEQANNTRRNVVIEHDGRKQTLSQWAREFGIKPTTLWARLNTQGLPFEEAIKP